jgi:hypothetical protein
MPSLDQVRSAIKIVEGAALKGRMVIDQVPDYANIPSPDRRLGRAR